VKPFNINGKDTMDESHHRRAEEQHIYDRRCSIVIRIVNPQTKSNTTYTTAPHANLIHRRKRYTILHTHNTLTELGGSPAIEEVTTQGTPQPHTGLDSRERESIVDHRRAAEVNTTVKRATMGPSTAGSG
jgi:hypothetical protein